MAPSASPRQQNDASGSSNLSIGRWAALTQDRSLHQALPSCLHPRTGHTDVDMNSDHGLRRYPYNCPFHALKGVPCKHGQMAHELLNPRTCSAAWLFRVKDRLGKSLAGGFLMSGFQLDFISHRCSSQRWAVVEFIKTTRFSCGIPSYTMSMVWTDRTTCSENPPAQHIKGLAPPDAELFLPSKSLPHPITYPDHVQHSSSSESKFECRRQYSVTCSESSARLPASRR